MGRVSCFYCQSTPSKISGLTLHTLPADKHLRNAWLKACGYNENDYSPDRRICSHHFEDECYKATARKLLKPGSVPTKFHKISQYLYVNKPKKQIIETSDSEPSCSHNDKSQFINEKTPKRRRNRYVGDVTTPDLSTPKHAKENFTVAKLKIIKQRRKIKTLTQKINRLQKKLSSLKTLFAYMKKQNLLSEVAHDNILPGSLGSVFQCDEKPWI
ncbi:THAP domain-containing protein 1-like isoform X2 [Rhopalosiphum padi]|uniref:THAP domain-containing protein 1-like isoform X2 n=1 Tax=Rhopalosiphum padi TaxID=40932 RepID=UPI00298DCA2A|nr:THAP domain-containing protein 1-like isoform X2 [Rhopalosiphum padi]